MDAIILVRGKKAAACWRSSISPRSFSGWASTRAISSAKSWVKIVWAIAMPTLPAPITEILVWRLVGDGGDVFWMGLKNISDRSRPPGPKEEAEALFCMVKSERWAELFCVVRCFVRGDRVSQVFVVFEGEVGWRKRTGVSFELSTVKYCIRLHV